MSDCSVLLTLTYLWFLYICYLYCSDINEYENEDTTEVPEMTTTLIQSTFTLSGDGPQNDWVPILLLPHKSIKGGSVALSKEFPHMALIGYGERESVRWQCGGTLISNRYVLSAAHCTYVSTDMDPARWVRLGELDLGSDSDDARPEDFSITERINHPGYMPPLVYNDIALYKLDRDVSFNEYVYPICLQRYTRENFTNGTVTGWGRIGVAEPTSPQLMKADVAFFNHKDCSELIPRSPQLPRGLNPRTQICAGDIKGDKDTCQGDSGGPLTSGDRRGIDCRNNQVGITSFGRVCGTENSPGVYTKVAYYIPWIESITTENQTVDRKNIL